MKEIVKRIKELGFDEYAVITEGGQKTLMVFMFYGYYKETGADNLPVSPYYFASNRAYFSAKALTDYITALGYRAVLDNHTPYDDALEKCGAIRGGNNLFFIEGAGSLFCVHKLITDAPMEDRTLTGKKCLRCGRCVQACPMGALGNMGINRNMCLRHRMDIVDDDVCREKVSTLLGCDVCQRVCPNNSGETKEARYNEFDKHKILKGDMHGVGESVGKNMARKSRLQYQALCVCANRRDETVEETVGDIDNPMIEKTKKWCMDILKNID